MYRVFRLNNASINVWFGQTWVKYFFKESRANTRILIKFRVPNMKSNTWKKKVFRINYSGYYGKYSKILFVLDKRKTACLKKFETSASVQCITTVLIGCFSLSQCMINNSTINCREKYTENIKLIFSLNSMLSIKCNSRRLKYFE